MPSSFNWYLAPQWSSVMNDLGSENFELFKSFIRISWMCGIGKFELQRGEIVELFSRIHSFALAFIFAWISITNHVNKFYTHYDGLIGLSRGIDRSELMLMAAALCFEAAVRKRKDFKVITSMDRLDKILGAGFGVKFDRRLMKFINAGLTFVIITPPCLVVRQYFDGN